MEIRSNFKFILLFGIFLISSVIWNPVLAQIPTEAGASVKITSPTDSTRVPSGELTIYGTSSDDDTKDCQVFADWNDLKPMQNVTPQGPKGNEDYSKWSYTYTSGYHNIVEGANELTSKITCYDQAQNAISKSYSINVTGKNEGSETNNTVQQSDVNTDTKKEAKILPVQNTKSSNGNDSVQQSDVNTDTKKEDANILPVQNSKSNNGNDSVQQSDVNTDSKKEDANILPVQNTKSSGTYKILPLYTESNEKVASSDSSKNGDITGVTNTDNSETQIIANTNVKTLSSEQREDPKANNNTGQTQDSHIPLTDSNVKSLSSEHPPVSKETTVSDTSKSPTIQTTDRKLSTETNTNRIFTFEPNLPADEKISGNQNNPLIKNPDSDSLLNHNNEGSSVFGLKMKTFNEDTKTVLDNKIQKLHESIADKMHLFGLVG